MSKRLFTEKEVKELSTNPFVKSVGPKGITYTDEFKEIFIKQRLEGKFPKHIFQDCGFDVEVIGIKRIHSASKRWRNAYQKDGLMGLRDTRVGNSGRPRERQLSAEEINARLMAEIHLLKAENELLKKIRFAERGLIKGK